MAKQRKVKTVNGYGKFTSANTIEVEASDGTKTIVGFENCIIAAGSSVTKLPFIPWEDERVWADLVSLTFDGIAPIGNIFLETDVEVAQVRLVCKTGNYTSGRIIRCHTMR